jgi:hypothetical protein
LLYLSARPGEIRQGEILGKVWEHQVIAPATELISDAPNILSRAHELVVVVTPDCDVLWDYEIRFPDESSRASLTEAAGVEQHVKYLAHVMVCDVFTEAELRAARGMNAGIWRTVTRNQDPRYHRLADAHVGSRWSTPIPPVVIDFKRVWAAPTSGLYAGLAAKQIRRLAVIPPTYLHDMLQRLIAFSGRVALPDP